MNKILKTTLIVCAVTGVSMLVSMKFSNHEYVDIISNKQAVNTFNKHAIDSAISLLRSGYLVLRTGLGADSYLLSQMNRKDKTYSHCGIVMYRERLSFCLSQYRR